MKHCFRCYAPCAEGEPCVRIGRSYADLKKALAFAKSQQTYVEIRDDFRPRSTQLLGYAKQGQIILREIQE